MTVESESTRIVASTLHARTTGTEGRFVLDGGTFQLVADGSVATGGPGRAPGSLDFFIASLVTCGLNVLRGADLGDDPSTLRDVEIFARVEREEDDDDVGILVLEIFIAGTSAAEADALVEDYRAHCRVYDAFRSIMPVVLVPHGDDH